LNFYFLTYPVCILALNIKLLSCVYAVGFSDKKSIQPVKNFAPTVRKDCFKRCVFCDGPRMAWKTSNKWDGKTKVKLRQLWWYW